MERWLFLGKERRKKIERFSYDLRDEFGKEFWDFSRFVSHMTARQPVESGYSLDDCFKLAGELRDSKLVIGQMFLRTPMIRSCFRNQDIWADFMVADTPENYIRVDGIFLPIFRYKLEDYPHQQKI
jgi:hypothetical protein